MKLVGPERFILWKSVASVNIPLCIHKGKRLNRRFLRNYLRLRDTIRHVYLTKQIYEDLRVPEVKVVLLTFVQGHSDFDSFISY